jgi:transcriptional regulator with XRE-family HTH domain
VDYSKHLIILEGSDFMATFGERLKELRIENGLTLDELKDYLNTTKATLSRYENGLRDPKIDFAKKIATYFNVSLDYILGSSDTRDIVPIPNSKAELSKELAIKVVNELLKEGYEIQEKDIPNLIMAAKIALQSNKTNQEN